MLRVAGPQIQPRKAVQHRDLLRVWPPARSRRRQPGQSFGWRQPAGGEQHLDARVAGIDPGLLVLALLERRPDAIGVVDRAPPGLREAIEELDPGAVARRQLERLEQAEQPGRLVLIAGLDRGPGRRQPKMELEGQGIDVQDPVRAGELLPRVRPVAVGGGQGRPPERDLPIGVQSGREEAGRRLVKAVHQQLRSAGQALVGEAQRGVGGRVVRPLHDSEDAQRFGRQPVGQEQARELQPGRRPMCGSCVQRPLLQEHALVGERRSGGRREAREVQRPWHRGRGRRR